MVGETTKRGVWAALTRARRPAGPPAEAAPGALFSSLFADAPSEVASRPAARGADRDATLLGWALREVAPWRLRQMRRAETARLHAALHARRDGPELYRFAGGDATLVARPDAAAPGHRAMQYLAFFKDVARLLPPGFTTTLCMGMGDRVAEPEAAPLFCFQKKRGAGTLLMPDLDFLEQDFYEADSFTDRMPYDEKRAAAVFAGATTGGMIDVAAARTLAIPRLRAAGYFQGNKRVDFRLPRIVQCTTPEAEALLRAQAFTQRPLLSLEEQFASRFMLSMDGNGATCSRVAVALHSRCVLLKYDSDDVLYYFGGLQPWVHYVPVGADSDVEKILDMEARDPAVFRTIADMGRAFAQTYLVRQAVQRYAALLLQAYEASFAD